MGNKSFSGFGYETVMESGLWEMESESGKSYNCPSLLPGETFQLHMQGGGTQPEGSWEKQ